MQVTLSGDSFGRVVGTIAHDGAHATVSGSNFRDALAELHAAVESALLQNVGECFWREALGEYRWLFRREAQIMRVVVLRSTGTLTGWEHCFWAECGAYEFRTAMFAALDTCHSSPVIG